MAQKGLDIALARMARPADASRAAARKPLNNLFPE